MDGANKQAMTRPEVSERRHAVQYAVSRVLAEAETLREATPKILRATAILVARAAGPDEDRG